MAQLGLFRLGRDRLGGPGPFNGGVAMGRPVSLVDIIARRRPALWAARLWVFDAESGDVTDVPCGTFTIDVQADDWPRRTLSATLVGPSAVVLAALQAPRATLRVSATITSVETGQSWTVDAGAFHPRLDFSHDADSGVQVNVRADDVSARVKRASLRSRRIVTSPGPLEQVVQQVLAATHADLTVTSETTGVTVGRLVLTADRKSFWEQLAGVAFAKGFDLTVDATGGVRLEHLPETEGQPVVTWDTAQRTVSVVSTSSGAPVLDGVSIVDGLGTLWIYPPDAAGMIAAVTDVDRSQVRTKAEAMEVGRAKLAKMRADADPGVSVTVPFDPWRDANDIVKVVDRDLGVAYTGRITKLSWSATAGQVEPFMTVQIANTTAENPDPPQPPPPLDLGEEKQP